MVQHSTSHWVWGVARSQEMGPDTFLHSQGQAMSHRIQRCTLEPRALDHATHVAPEAWALSHGGSRDVLQHSVFQTLPST